MFDIKKIQQALSAAGLDGWLFYQFHDLDPMADRILHLPAGRMSSRRWFYWVPAAGEPVRLVHAIEAAALDEVPGSKKLYVGWRQMEEILREILAGKGKVAMQYSPGNAIPYISRVDAGTVELVRSCGPEVVSSADLVQVFEAVMDDAQEESHMEASRILPEIVMEAYGEVAQAVAAGKPRSEYEIQQFIMERFAAHDMETHHPPIVAVDAHAGDPHFEVPENGSALITEGSFLLTDIWAKFSKPRSIYADITWTGFVGKEVPDEHAKIFDIVRRARVAAQDHVIAACAAGREVRGWEADDACRAVVQEAGYQDRFLHRTGHSIGEEVHGNGANVDNLETRDERLLLPRTCFSVEPGIYLENFGVRSEVNMIIHEDGRAQVSGRQQDAVVPILTRERPAGARHALVNHHPPLGVPMSLLVAVVFAYPVILLGVSIWRSRAVKSHADFMVAGRSVPVAMLVGTLVCTWIGSGSLFGGAGLAYRTGIAELWFSFGGWVGLVVAYFIAGRVRRIAQYTVPDLLEQRYNAAARVFGTIAVVLAYVTIAAYQFRGGGWILSIVTDGAISPEMGMYITAAVVVTFTVLAGMVSIVTVDIFNGVIITAGVLFALPYMVFSQGGIGKVMANLPAEHTTVLGGHNPLWVFGVAMPTFLLILGESGMYQKFFAAKNAKAARQAVVGMLAGIVIIETTLALLAIVGRAAYPDLMNDTSIVGRAASETIILYMARHGLPVVAGALLLAAAIAIVLSTGNTFLLVPSTNVSRDLYERFMDPDASDKRKLLVQRLSIVAFGILGIILLDYFPTVLSMALYAYSLVGASLTPALMAAFLWRRVTAQGGMACIAGGLLSIVGIKILNAAGYNFTLTLGGTAFDFASSDYIVVPGVLISTSLLIVVSLLTAPSPRAKWEPFFTPQDDGQETI